MKTARKTLSVVVIIACLFFMTAAAVADWDVGDPAKWVQLPDLSETGIDVKASPPNTIADDFNCTSKNKITNIHLWGSWLNDVPPINPSFGSLDVIFHLGIREDLPVGDPRNPHGYSVPGDLLWEHDFDGRFGQFGWRKQTEVALGHNWYDPGTGEVLPSTSSVWQFNFFISPHMAFAQQGTVDDPVTYWLEVEATLAGEHEGALGWKTSLDHWNDDAVWAYEPLSWYELRYPDGHEYQGQSIDLAFVITPEPATLALLLLGGLALLKHKRST